MSARERTVAFQADVVLEQLRDTVPEALWGEVLRAALLILENS